MIYQIDMRKESLLADINYMSNYVNENEELLSSDGNEKLDEAFLRKDDLNENLDSNPIELLLEVHELYIELQCAFEDYESDIENDLIISEEERHNKVQLR
ncbi:hypothetical protein [Lutimonas vermicola]|uniref:Uncharacterized protein n=1 Tax=Lutimonas vermicola TaxID=414288 RepID=A0ABU9L522_9FLAO